MQPRQILKKLLTKLTKVTIKKHNPEIIVVTGKGQTSIVREALYTVLHEKHPVRRNLEYPEAEFSIPLTILGIDYYPTTIIGWINAAVKTIARIAKNKAFKHVLILEINSTNLEVFNHWISILNPIKMVDTPKGIDLTSRPKLSQFVSACFSKKLMKKFEISVEYIESQLDKLHLPSSKIRLRAGKNNSTIVDSTYYYYPPPIISALEIAELLEGNKVIFTEFKKDMEYLVKNNLNWIVNPNEYEPSDSDVILLRLNKVHGRSYVKNLT